MEEAFVKITGTKQTQMINSIETHKKIMKRSNRIKQNRNSTHEFPLKVEDIKDLKNTGRKY